MPASSGHVSKFCVCGSRIFQSVVFRLVMASFDVCAVLAGVTGGPVRGVTNHFIPVKPFSTGNKNTELFPGQWKKKVCPCTLSCSLCLLPPPVDGQGTYVPTPCIFFLDTTAPVSNHSRDAHTWPSAGASRLYHC